MKLFWIKRVFGGLLFAVVFITAAGWAVSSLWNWLIPALFAGPIITFGQALGLLLLTRLLVGFRGGWGGRRWGGGGPHMHPENAFWREKLSSRWQNMTPEERQKFKQQMKEQWKGGCGPGRRGFGRRWEEESEPAQPGNPAEPTATNI